MRTLDLSGSTNTNITTGKIKESEPNNPNNLTLRRSGRNLKPTKFYQPCLSYVNYTDATEQALMKKVWPH